MVKTADKIMGITLVIGGDATTLGKELKNVNTESKSLNSELKSIKSGLKFSPDSVELLKQKTQVAAEQTEVLKKKQDILRDALSQVQSQAARGDLGADKVREVEREYIKVTSQLKNLRVEGEKPALNGWQKSFKNLADNSKKTTSEVSTHFQNLKSSIMGAVAGTGLVLGIKTLATTISGLADSASDLSEAQNVIDQTFKSSSGAVKDWTTTLAKSAGISQTDASKFVGSMGAMLKSSGVAEQSAANMSESLVQLTGDMSSFYNVGTSDMWEKIRSGISGETEPLKQLGINMSVANLQAFALAEGIKKPYASMTQAEQTMLRYNYLLNVTKDAQGDFANTLDSSLANQSRVFQMNMEQMKQRVGQEFLPMMNDVYSELNPLVEELMPDIAAGARQVASDIMAHKTDIINTVKNIVGGIKDGIKFVSEHGNDIKRVVEIGTVALVAWKATLIACNAAASIYNGIQTVMAIKTAIVTAAKGVETAATVTETTAQWGLNAALSANPFGAVAVAVGALAAGIAFLCTQTNDATAAENEQIKSINDECQAWEDLKKTTYDQASSDLAEIDRAEKMLDWLNKNTDATGKLTGSKTEAAKAVDIINKTTGKDELKLNGDMVQGLQDQKKAIDELIKSKKAKILLDANEGNYKAALTDRTKVEDEQGALGRQIKDNKAKLKNINDQREAMRANNTLNADMAIKVDNQSDLIETSLNSEIEAFNKNEKRLSEYYENIHNYETASAEYTQGHYDKVSNIYADASINLKQAGDATEEELRKQYDDLSETASQMEARWKSGDKNITESMVTEAKDRAQKAYDEYINFGVSAGDGIKSGTDSAKSDVKSAGKSMGDTFKSGINSSDPKEIGKNYANNVLAGFVQSMRAAEEELTSSSTTPSGSIFTSYNNYKAGHNAHGTSFWPGGFTWVGENGPEKVYLPRGVSILPNHESMQIDAAMGNHNSVASTPQVLQLAVNINGDNIFNTESDIDSFSNKIGLEVLRRLS